MEENWPLERHEQLMLSFKQVAECDHDHVLSRLLSSAQIYVRDGPSGKHWTIMGEREVDEGERQAMSACQKTWTASFFKAASQL